MSDQAQQARLTRMRRIATGLLLLMVLLLLVSYPLQRRDPAFAFLTAFAEAAMVGALADWFAVTALFRRPLGLPIPHTAIIPTNKERIGNSIANFLETNFITHEVIRAELELIDFSGTAADWLARPANRRAVASQVAAALPAALRLFGDEQAGRFLREALAGSVRGVKLAPLLAQLLSVLVQGRQHHVLLERVLGIVARALERNRPFIRQKVHEHSPRWLPKAIDEKLYERLMEGVNNTLLEIQGENSEWRDRFQAATEELIARLATSPEYEDKLQDLLAHSLGHPALRDYAADVWRDIRIRIEADAAAPQPRLTVHAERALDALGTALGRNRPVQERLNRWIRDFAADTIVARRAAIVSVVRRVIHSWDGDTVARRFELYVGRDLQFIRINGTLVGGGVGLALHAIPMLF